MIDTCPHCNKPLDYTSAQRNKIAQALKTQPPDKSLKLKCPACKKSFLLDNGRKQTKAKVAAGRLAPPPPPNVDWLRGGNFEAEEKLEDVPRALVLHPEPNVTSTIQESMETVGYQTMAAATVDEAIEKMRFLNFSCIVLHDHFEASSLDDSELHRFMCRMPMSRRRYIFYILLGKELQTLYDMQALALSANLVVAERDLKYFDVILRKAIPDYEELFGPELEELSAYGKK
jgi:CheY-like chemotaxis protein